MCWVETMLWLRWEMNGEHWRNFFFFLAHCHKALDSLMRNPASSFRNGFSFLPFLPLAGCLHLVCSLFCLCSSDPQWPFLESEWGTALSNSQRGAQTDVTCCCVFLLSVFFQACFWPPEGLYLIWEFVSVFLTSQLMFSLSMNPLKILYKIHFLFLFSSTGLLFRNANLLLPLFSSLPFFLCSYDHCDFSASFPGTSEFETLWWPLPTVEGYAFRCFY